MRHEISIEQQFPAAHSIRLYDGAYEPIHGHNWRVRITLGRDALDAIGVVVDFHELHRRLAEVILPWKNGNLNDDAVLLKHNPTAENVAVAIAERLPKIPAVVLLCVEVWETPDCKAVFKPMAS
jgi:6-pyruvoyltetrahydropterin/6-carboxytetrahydropterin synthase